VNPPTPTVTDRSTEARAMTPDSMINKRLVAIFLLGWTLFNYPLLSLPNINTLCLGIPLLYLYLFSVWGGLILLILLTTRSRINSQYPDSRR
jgi:hypothetical protein